MTRSCDLITILGPTASGKTSVAVALAQRMGGEILSADSRQVYRGMDIGTGKDLEEYRTLSGTIPVHLIDIADAGEEYDLYRYVCDFASAFSDIAARGRQPIMCGGSGMYLDAVIRGYALRPAPADRALALQLEQMDDEAIILLLKGKNRLHNTTDTTDRQRLLRAAEIAMAGEGGELAVPLSDFSALNHRVVGIAIPRDRLRERITQRLMSRLESGMVEEVDVLLQNGIAPEKLRYYGLEYRYITDYCTGVLTRTDMVRLLNTAIHQFAKRQMTWFRRMEKNNIPIHWIQGDRDAEEMAREAISVVGC